jgi:integrase
MAFRLSKNRRKATWYFARRVPLQYQHLDPRGMIRKTTGVRISADPHGVAARRVAEGMDTALESYWSNLAAGRAGKAKAMADYEAACQAAAKLGVSPPLPQQAQRTIEELLARIERLEHGAVAEDKANVMALLDAAPMPEVTFRESAEQYIDAHKAGWSNAKHAKQWPATLQVYAYPIIGNMPVAQLAGRSGTHKIKEVLDPIWYSKPTTAMRVRGRIESVLDWAKVHGYLDGDNPARWKGHLDSIYPTKEKLAPVEHHAAMPYRQVPDFMRKLRQTDGVAARALEFAILTAARSAEVLQARWSEIDREGRTWVIPKGRMKMRRPHRQPLGEAAIAILDALPKDSDLIFPGERKGKPLDHKALQRVLERIGVDAVPHGFRSSFRDWGAEVGNFPNEILELALAHTVGDKVEAAYRRGEMLEKRHRLMGEWQVFCDGKRGAGRQC